MPKNILRITCAKMESTQHVDGSFMKSLDIDFLGSFFALATNKRFDLFFGCRNDFFDASRVDATVDNEFFERLSSYLTTYRVKATNDYNAWRVIDNQIAARDLFE